MDYKDQAMRLINKIKYCTNKHIHIGKRNYSALSVSIKCSNVSTINVGSGFRALRNTTIHADEDGRIEIGNNVFVNENCNIAAHQMVKIEDNVKIGPNTMIYDHDHNYKTSNNEYISSDIRIGKNTWIGANCVILRGSQIGEGCVIGAGTIIKGSIKPGTIVYTKSEYVEKEM